MNQEAQRLERESENKKKDGFQKFLQEPLTKLSIAQIPGDEHQEILRALLESCYNSGFASGQADVGVALISLMLKDSKDKP